MKEMMTSLLADESGQGMAEYGLILALVAVVVVGALTLLGQGLDGIFDKVTEDVNSTTGS